MELTPLTPIFVSIVFLFIISLAGIALWRNSHILIITRQLAECLNQRMKLENELLHLRQEVEVLRQKLDDAHDEIDRLRSVVFMLARAWNFQSSVTSKNEPADAISTVFTLLRQEREQLLKNIAYVQLQIAREGDDVTLRNRLDYYQKRLRDIDNLLDSLENKTNQGDDVGKAMGMMTAR